MEKTGTEQVDAYIARAADFAHPILTHLRELVHRACPAAEEKIKWGFPNFEYQGILCNMAAFKSHCAFNFWKASAMDDPHGILQVTEKAAMGSLGKITMLEELPKDAIMLEYLQEAMKMNEQKVKRVSLPSEPVSIPDYFLEILSRNKEADSGFRKLAPSHRKEYAQWIAGAKKEETRERRIRKALVMLAKGLPLDAKYEKN